MRSRKYSVSTVGSSVVPDLLETMHSVRDRSSRDSTRRICAGSVESRTCSAGAPAAEPRTRLSTSGHKLDPPIPRSRTSVSPAALISCASDASASPGAPTPTTSSQPSHRASSAPVQTPASFAQSRGTIPARVHTRTVSTSAASSTGPSHVPFDRSVSPRLRGRTSPASPAAAPCRAGGDGAHHPRTGPRGTPRPAPPRAPPR